MLTTTFSLTAVSYNFTNNLPVSPPTPVVNNLLLSKSESWQLTLIGRAAAWPRGAARTNKELVPAGRPHQRRLSWTWLTMAAQRQVMQFLV